ncbi:MAG: FHA domain-containing protein [Myxococcota bacterium]
MRHVVTPYATTLLLLLSVVLSTGPARAGAKLDVDYVNAEDFVEKGEIRLFVDLLDDDYEPIGGLNGENITVTLGDEEVPGTIEVQTAEEAREWVAVAVLMAAHRSYASWTLEQVAGEEREPDVFKFEQQGFANFVRKLSGNDKVAVWTYDEKALRLVEDWTENHKGTAETVEERARPQPSEDAAAFSPDLYRYIKEIIDDRIGGAQNLPRRRVLLLMSDGKDKRPKKIQRRLEPIVEAARTNGVKVYAVGFTMDTSEYLVHLKSLASKTDGVYREIDTTDMDSIPLVLEQIADELKKQYVLTFKPNEDYDGSEKPVALTMEVETPDGQIVEDEYDIPIKPGEKAFDWVALLIWIGVGLGGLLLLVLLIKLVGAIVRSRREAAGQVVEEPDYQGPYKGKLLATSGPHVGEEFYLVEDVTTIGSIQGNGIVLADPGVSKRHAGIKVEDMRFELADFGSTNGTLVNGQKITKQFLRDGDEIQLGETVLRFSLK